MLGSAVMVGCSTAKKKQLTQTGSTETTAAVDHHHGSRQRGDRRHPAAHRAVDRGAGGRHLHQGAGIGPAHLGVGHRRDHPVPGPAPAARGRHRVADQGHRRRAVHGQEPLPRHHRGDPRSAGRRRSEVRPGPGHRAREDRGRDLHLRRWHVHHARSALGDHDHRPDRGPPPVAALHAPGPRSRRRCRSWRRPTAPPTTRSSVPTDRSRSPSRPPRPPRPRRSGEQHRRSHG